MRSIHLLWGGVGGRQKNNRQKKYSAKVNRINSLAVALSVCVCVGGGLSPFEKKLGSFITAGKVVALYLKFYPKLSR